ncbi:8440_t:CDS:2 [Entrophospora sp. SA101]|nr:8440_t:CDS:2 [Entrophospora sp. SA101]
MSPYSHNSSSNNIHNNSASAAANQSNNSNSNISSSKRNIRKPVPQGPGPNQEPKEYFENSRTKLLIGHTKTVRTVAWNCDGRKLASGSVDKTVRLWEADQEDIKYSVKLFIQTPYTAITTTPTTTTIANDNLSPLSTNPSYYSNILNSVRLEDYQDDDNLSNITWPPPSRKVMLDLLKGLNKDLNDASTTKHNSSPSSPHFDLLVIGGGATGSGVALDAATRGLKVALVERDDFASGTSSRSTKLVHGGVRYLEKAFKELDYGQYKLVKEALHERANFFNVAPYLCFQLPIMLPIYKWWQVPYYWIGSKTYDLLAGKEGVENSYFLTCGKALDAFPMLNNDKLVGAMVYYDG